MCVRPRVRRVNVRYASVRPHWACPAFNFIMCWQTKILCSTDEDIYVARKNHKLIKPKVKFALINNCRDFYLKMGWFFLWHKCICSICDQLPKKCGQKSDFPQIMFVYNFTMYRRIVKQLDSYGNYNEIEICAEESDKLHNKKCGQTWRSTVKIEAKRQIRTQFCLSRTKTSPWNDGF